MKGKVLIINTGGTIGMVNSVRDNPLSPLRPAKDWSELEKGFPMLGTFNIRYHQFDPLIDSSDMSPDTWIEIGRVIEKNYDEYVGFVVLHGTDTMAYTASALSYILKNLGKPVILTGSQVPLQNIRSDALQNLVTAIEIASGGQGGAIPCIPEVCVFFRDTLLRGNRVRKMDATNYFGFSSPNFLPLGRAGKDITITSKLLFQREEDKFYIDPHFSKDVFILEVFPGLNPMYLMEAFKVNKGIRGVILKTYGNGNAPTNKEFLEALKFIVDQGIVVVNITQCSTGSVQMGLYEASASLEEIGVISGLDLTPEAALTKLMYILGKTSDVDEIRDLIQVDICGEQTLNHHIFKKSVDSKENEMEFTVEIPKTLKNRDLVEGKLQVRVEVEEGFDGSRGAAMVEMDICGYTSRGEENVRDRVEVPLIKSSSGGWEILINLHQTFKKVVQLSDKVILRLRSKESILWKEIKILTYSQNA